MNGPAGPAQGEVYISDPSQFTGVQELRVVVSADIYNQAGGPIVLVAEIETGILNPIPAYATETDYGLVRADRVNWLPVDMLGEHLGALSGAQRSRVVDQIVAVLRGS